MWNMTAEAEDVVYSDQFSNNGACPMWCFNNTCVVRVGEEVFASGYERIPGAPPMNDCRWAVWQRTADGCAPSWTLDLLGHRRGGWRPAAGTGGCEWEGTVSYACVRSVGRFHVFISEVDG